MRKTPRVELDALDRRILALYQNDNQRTAESIGAGRVRSVVSSALGQGCTQSGMFVGLTSWREVDAAIVRFGTFLRDRDLREEITVCVDAEPELIEGE
jgi:hypothetical protein